MIKKIQTIRRLGLRNALWVHQHRQRVKNNTYEHDLPIGKAIKGPFYSPKIKDISYQKINSPWLENNFVAFDESESLL